MVHECGALDVSATTAGDVIRPVADPNPNPAWSLLAPLLRPFAFAAVTVGFLSCIVYMLFVMLAQGLGMLILYLVMPHFMRLVYPSRLGQIHTVALTLYRNCMIGEEGHSRSIRIDLHAGDASDASDASDAADFVGDGDASARGAAAVTATTATAAAAAAATGSGCGEAVEQREARLPRTLCARPSAGDLPYSVHTVACLTDNYCYLLVDRSGPVGRPHAVALVDPCESGAVVRALERLEREEYVLGGLQPVAILTTHKHWDHAGGNRALKRRYPQLRVYGGVEDRVAAATHHLSDGDELRVGSLTVRALHAPCHTKGSMCFYVGGVTPALFGGDTLFCGGCGAPFEGTQDQMGANFTRVWLQCAPNTLIFPGHEYTLAILPGYLSGATPLPDHPCAFGKVGSLLWRATQLRAAAPPTPTVPLLLADELLINSNFAALRHAADCLARAYLQRSHLLA